MCGVRASAETWGCARAGKFSTWLLSVQGRGSYCKVSWSVGLQTDCVLIPACSRYTSVQEKWGELSEEVWTAHWYPALFHSSVLPSRQNQKPYRHVDLTDVPWTDFPQGFPVAVHKHLNPFLFLFVHRKTVRSQNRVPMVGLEPTASACCLCQSVFSLSFVSLWYYKHKIFLRKYKIIQEKKSEAEIDNAVFPFVKNCWSSHRYIPLSSFFLHSVSSVHVFDITQLLRLVKWSNCRTKH